MPCTITLCIAFISTSSDSLIAHVNGVFNFMVTGATGDIGSAAAFTVALVYRILLP